jgi:GABA(A) receptor-associated protein
MNPPSLKPDEINRLRNKYPDRIPIILKKGNTTVNEIVRSKFLVPSTITFGEFIGNIRRLYKLKPEKALFFYINDSIPNNSEQVYVIHQKYAVDGALNVVYSEENTFG